VGSERRPVPWGRFVAEGLTIIVGILIALWADAWWEDRSERAAEQVILHQLSAEFADNALQLDSVLDWHQRGLDAARALLGVARGELRLESDSLGRLVWAVDQPWTFNPKQGALESLIGSGQLGIIRDDSLRFALASWPGVLADFTEDERHAGDFTRGPQFDYFSSVLDWSDIYSPREGPLAPSLGHLVGDEGLGSVMSYRISWLETIQGESHGVTEVSNRIRALIRRSLWE